MAAAAGLVGDAVIIKEYPLRPISSAHTALSGFLDPDLPAVPLFVRKTEPSYSPAGAAFSMRSICKW
eukprot:COSAG05_NODE_126_length_17260_cov_8.550434_14_plen_67_part_00